MIFLRSDPPQDQGLPGPGLPAPSAATVPPATVVAPEKSTVSANLTWARYSSTSLEKEMGTNPASTFWATWYFSASCCSPGVRVMPRRSLRATVGGVTQREYQMGKLATTAVDLSLISTAEEAH